MKNPSYLNGLEIVLPKPESFLIIKETLTRIGLTNKTGNRLFQTCHILFKKNKYFILHFKELFILDGKSTNFTQTDRARRNSIINYLIEKKFFVLASGKPFIEPYLPHTTKNDDLTIIPHDQKNQWELVQKYTIGNPANKP